MNDSIKTAAQTAAAAGLARFIGRYLASKPAGIGLGLLMSPARLLSMVIGPSEAAVLGGGIAGLTVAEAVRKVFPGVKEDLVKFIGMTTVLIAIEYAEAVSDAGSGREDGGGTPGSRRETPPQKAAGGKRRFADLLGHALCDPDPRVSGPARRLMSILTSNRLRPRQYDQLQACDSPAKFMALANCADAAELGNILLAMVHPDDRGIPATIGHGLEVTASELGTAVRSAASVLRKADRALSDANGRIAADLGRRTALTRYAARKGISLREAYDAIDGFKRGIESPGDLTAADIDEAVAAGPQGAPSKIDALKSEKLALRERRDREYEAKDRKRRAGNRKTIIKAILFCAVTLLLAHFLHIK